MKQTFDALTIKRFIEPACLGLAWLLLLAVASPVKGDVDTVGTLRRFFDNIPGTAISDLTTNINYINNNHNAFGVYPDMQYPLPGQTPVVSATGNGQSFTGWLIPTQTGNYVFWIGGCDATALYLSPGTGAGGKVLIAHTDTATAYSPTTYLPDWSSIKDTSGVSSHNTFTFNGGAPGVVTLQAGQPYYFLVLHKAGTVNPGIVAVGWTQPNDAPSPNGPTQVISQYALCPHSGISLPNINLITNNNAGVLANPYNDAASRFLAQATFGPTISSMTALGTSLAANPSNPTQVYSDWIDAQFALPLNTNDFDLTSDLSLGVYHAFVSLNGGNGTNGGPNYPGDSYHTHTYQGGAVRASFMIKGPNEANQHDLRRKVAWALSQIFVVGDVGNTLYAFPEGECDYYDLLFKDAFSTYTQLLTDVTYHPMMGDFLSSAKSAQAGYYSGLSAPSVSHPDENYGREIMQLFALGLWRLNLDGTYVLDGNGKPIPTYGDTEVQQMAKAFTGLDFPQGVAERATAVNGTNSWSTYTGDVRYGTMVARTIVSHGLAPHDTTEKLFPAFDGWYSPVAGSNTSSSGHVGLPAGQTMAQDVAGAITILANNPNTAPFFCKAMIQHLVTSNPSAGYVSRVATVFQSSGGDLRQVVKAILLDSEARTLNNILQDSYGKYQEQWIRLIAISRAMNAPPYTTSNPNYPLFESNLLPIFGEYPLGSPSVFNFYLPGYAPHGDISERGMVGPEFQVLNANTGIKIPNYFMDQVAANVVSNSPSHVVTLDYTAQLNLAVNANDLVDHFNTLLTHGTMSTQTYNTVVAAVNAVTLSPTPTTAQKTKRVKTALYLIAISPDFAVQK